MALVKSTKGWRAEIEHIAMENIKSCFFLGAPCWIKANAGIRDVLHWVISGPQQRGWALKSLTYLGQHRAGTIPSLLFLSHLLSGSPSFFLPPVAKKTASLSISMVAHIPLTQIWFSPN